MTIRVILDTDIGTDVDDCLALSLILNSPEFKLEGVTCVYGDVLLRARMTLKVMKLHGTEGIPVMIGATNPLLGLRPVHWEGHEGLGLLEPEDEALVPDPEHAVDFIVRTVMDNPGEIHLVTIGPLTNAALAFLKEPRLAQNLAHLTIMGGSLRNPDTLDLRHSEHNIVSDAEASHIVFSSGAPITLVPLDVTTQVFIRREDAAEIRAGGSPFHEAVAQQVELYPYVRDFGQSHMHDPLAVATILQPDLVELTHLRVDVETGGRLAQGMTIMRAPTVELPANIGVALKVDARRAERFLLERISRPLQH